MTLDHHLGPPVRLSVVAKLSGFSRHKLYYDIQRGDLSAMRVKCGTSEYWYIERPEILRYLGRDPFERKIGQLGGVYFVQSGDYIKIGVSSDVVQRLTQLQSLTPFKVVGLGWIPEADPKTRAATEREFHQMFQESRHRLEWFQATSELLDTIANRCEAWP